MKSDGAKEEMMHFLGYNLRACYCAQFLLYLGGAHFKKLHAHKTLHKVFNICGLY
jgi:hypothetical protein